MPIGWQLWCPILSDAESTLRLRGTRVLFRTAPPRRLEISPRYTQHPAQLQPPDHGCQSCAEDWQGQLGIPSSARPSEEW